MLHTPNSRNNRKLVKFLVFKPQLQVVAVYLQLSCQAIGRIKTSLVPYVLQEINSNFTVINIARKIKQVHLDAFGNASGYKSRTLANVQHTVVNGVVII